MVNWRKIHKENVRENEKNSLWFKRKLRKECILSFIDDGIVDVSKILKEIDRCGYYEKKELAYTCYSNYIQMVALRFVAYKYGLGFKMVESEGNWLYKPYNVVLTRKS